MTNPPAPKPCESCPYRRDVPSGVWHASEYDKLPEYDNETALQPMAVFMCHQQDGKVCAGWCATHDMNHAIAIRIGLTTGTLSPETAEAILDYKTTVPVFSSGAEAAEHGKREIKKPGFGALRLVAKIEPKIVSKKRRRG